MLPVGEVVFPAVGVPPLSARGHAGLGLMHAELERELVARRGLISRREAPHLISQMAWAQRSGQLEILMPAVYGVSRAPELLVRAVNRWDEDAVVTGAWAAKLLWWPELTPSTVEVATRRHPKRVPQGYAMTRAQYDPELVLEHEGVRVAHPAVAVLDLIPTMGGKAIDEALRRRATSLSALRWALKLTPERPGNAQRRALLRESRDEPWSPLERDAHVRLREARITGWKANHWIKLPTRSVCVDIAFPAIKLVIEIDGWEFHSSREQFVADRWRDVQLTTAGWTVIRFSAETLPQLVEIAHDLLRTRRSVAGAQSTNRRERHQCSKKAA